MSEKLNVQFLGILFSNPSCTLPIAIYANPSKFYILSLGVSDIEMKQGFIIHLAF